MNLCLRVSSLLVLCWLLSSCAPKAFHSLSYTGETIASSALQPHIQKQLYRCVVDGKVVLKKYHLSGLLFIKRMEDDAIRILFQNEMGVTFFDFSLLPNDSFVVNTIMDKLNKPALIKTLEKDFRMLLLRGMDEEQGKVFVQDGQHSGVEFLYKAAPVAYFTKGKAIQKVVNHSRNKKIVTLYQAAATVPQSMSDSIFIRHHRAHFTIELNALKDEPAEH